MRHPHLDRLIDLALDEDLIAGDVTSETTIPAGTTATAYVVAKAPLVVAGLDAFTRVFTRLESGVVIDVLVQDGDAVTPGTKVLRLSGDARAMLMGERVALNFLGRLSGIATGARVMAEAVAGTNTQVVDTRKTTPGLRMLEKAAVRAGGAHSHRTALFDGVLIKENHIMAAGGIAEAVQRARAGVHHLLRIEVETTTLDEVDQALAAGADGVMFDNMDNAMIADALKRVDAVRATGRPVFTEASGNMTLERLPGVAALGVDIISMGALTHSAVVADLSMRITLDER